MHPQIPKQMTRECATKLAKYANSLSYNRKNSIPVIKQHKIWQAHSGHIIFSEDASVCVSTKLMRLLRKYTWTP